MFLFNSSNEVVDLGLFIALIYLFSCLEWKSKLIRRSSEEEFIDVQIQPYLGGNKKI